MYVFVAMFWDVTLPHQATGIADSAERCISNRHQIKLFASEPGQTPPYIRGMNKF